MGLLNEIFGSDREGIWRTFAKEINGSFIEGKYGNGDRIEIDFEKWQIVFDIYISYTTAGQNSFKAEYTRIRTPFKSKDGLTFSITRKGLLNSISKLFGRQDIAVGYPDFDNAFIIKGNDEYKIQTLFSSDKLRDLLMLQKDIRLEIISDEGFWGEKLPAGVSELYYHADGAINDMQQLHVLYGMFGELLHQLSKSGSAVPSEKINYEPD